MLSSILILATAVTAPAGTTVYVRLLEPLSTKSRNIIVGQRVRIDVEDAVKIDGVTVIPTGSPGFAEVASVRYKGMWGRSGQIVLRMLFVNVNGKQVKIGGSWSSNGVTGTGAVLGALAVAPIAGFLATGTSAEMSEGQIMIAMLDEEVSTPPLP